MLIKEYRVILPMSVDEYKIAQLWSTAELSKNETGGGEGIEIKINEPFDIEHNAPNPKLLEGFDHGQYTFKIYHIEQKLPSMLHMFFPKGALEIEEKAWNAYPYCKTVLENPRYMKDKFEIRIETMHVSDHGQEENIHCLPDDLLEQREVIFIDIANDKLMYRSDYKEEQDPKSFKSEKSGRGPLINNPWWSDWQYPIMCAYKLVICEFKWWGLQHKVEKLIQKQEKRLFTNFHRMVFCWMDQWYGLTLNDVRMIESATQEELLKQLASTEKRGTMNFE